ncbi:MAG: ATP-dependent endonuclease [Chloroflexi bacterium]|nr:ATP-dependent endonuclease [Chloroflexota bacterium]
MAPPKPQRPDPAPTAPPTRLTRLYVRNYRSLEDVDVPLTPLTAFVGPNGSGKTSLLRALNLVLGDAWPSLRSFRIPEDFTNFETSRDIEIHVEFDPPYVHSDTLSTEREVTALRLTCKPYKRSGKWGEAGDLHVDLDPLDEQGDVPIVAVGQPQKGQKTQFAPLRVGTDLRDHARILFVDHRRSLAQHLPSVRGSILGRLLQKARKEFTEQDDFKRKYEAAMDTLRTEEVKEIENTIAETAKRMLGFLGRQTTQSVDIAFGFADPANPFNSLRLEYRESGLVVPGEELGLGIQSAMVVGIFEAFRRLGGDFGTIVIEEPEMYLHPQAQRYFYHLLCEMAEEGQCQVIYSTHSSIFADVNRFEALRVVRRSGGRTNVTYVQDEQRDELMKARDNLKLGTRFDAARNEVLFASRALLVEGFADRIAALMVAEKLGVDPDAEGFAVVDCGGKAGIELVVRVCRALQIPFVVLHDEDVWPTEDIADPAKRKRQEEENRAEQEMNERIKAAVGQDHVVCVISPSLEAAVGVSRDARDKPRKVAAAIEGVDVQNPPGELAPLFDAVNKLIRGLPK